jgi:hypothetical protein
MVSIFEPSRKYDYTVFCVLKKKQALLLKVVPDEGKGTPPSFFFSCFRVLLSVICSYDF